MQKKAPGPDGFSSGFFHANWELVGPDIIDAVKSFFQTGKILKAWNTTAISLIPKVQVPCTMKDFRPISCCNVVYKCISKLLVERIKPFLDVLVGPQQSAFVKGRHIADNILLMQELVRGYHRGDGPGSCALKIDIQKAYDSVDWGYLKKVLVAMNFHPSMVNWLMCCVTTPSYSISLNGYLEGFFNGAKGLRQGDPISPYLFILIMEAFSNLLDAQGEMPNFTFHPKCKDLKLSHVIFADDLFVLCGANIGSLELIKEAFDVFGNESGLKPNLMKSSMFLSGVSEEEKSRLSVYMGMEVQDFPVRYLGVPLISTRLKARDCESIKLRILNKIHCWTSKVLSYAGRIQLAVSVLVLPKQILKEIDATIRSFVWFGS